MKSVFVCLKNVLKHPLYQGRKTRKKILSQSLKDKNVNSVVLIITNTVNYSEKIELIEKMGSRGPNFFFCEGTRGYRVLLKGVLLNFKRDPDTTFKH